jgi:CHRD domain-containing protein
MKSISGTGKLLLSIAIGAFVFQACSSDNAPLPTSVKKWDNVTISAANEVPAPAGRTETGTLSLELLSNNSLKYNIQVNNLTAGDALVAAHIHPGNAGTNGGVLINFNPTFTGGNASGTVTGLRQGQIDSLLNTPVYFNVHSNQVASGLLRAQLDHVVKFAYDINLSGANENPAVTTTATGKAVLRLTDDKTLYSLVTVNGIETNDTITVSHIHRGAAGTNGPVRIFLASNKDDFGIPKTAVLVDSLYNILIGTDPIYVNAHSKLHGSGLVRGQIR